MNDNEQQVGLAVTGNDDIDFQNEIAALLNANEQPAQPVQQEVEIPIQGQKLKFKNLEEVGQKVADIAKNYQTLLAENAALKAQTQMRPAEPVSDPGKKPKGVNNEEFTKLVQQGDDGVAKAMNYWLNHAFFDGTQPDAAKAMQAILQQAVATTSDLTVLRFKEAHPELPRTPEAGQILEQVRTQYNLPFNNQGLEAAYAIARQHNLLQIEQPKQEQQTQQQTFATPPMSRQSASTTFQPTSSQEEKLWEIPMEQFDKLFRKRYGVGTAN